MLSTYSAKKFTINSSFSLMVMLILVTISGLATRFSRGVEISLIIFVISFAYITKRKALLNSKYIYACVIWFTYILLSYIKYHGDNYYWPFSYFFNITTAFAILLYFKNEFISKFASAIYYLSAYSLVLFAWQIINLDSMLLIWTTFDTSDNLFEKPFTYYAHSFFYTIHQFKDISKGAPRNSGFCWEPGAFACFIVVAIYFQMLCDSYRLEKNKFRYLILFSALLTTQSTTGLAGAFIIFFSYLINIRKESRGKYVLFATIIATPLIFMMPEQLGKIEMQLSDNLREHILMADANEHEKGIGRFQSIYILWIDFIENPILGIGANQSATWLSRMGLEGNPTSGIGNMMARYGIFLMVPFFFLLATTSKRLAAMVAPGRGKFALFWVVIILGFSFSIVETPIFLSIVFFDFFVRHSTKTNRIINN